MTAFTQRSGLHRWRAYAPAWLTWAAGLIVSVAAAAWFWREAEQLDRLRFETTVTNLIERLDTVTERYAEQLERFTDWIETQPRVSEAAWNEFVTRLGPASNLPALLELAYVTNSLLPSRAEVERFLANPQPPHYGHSSILPEPPAASFHAAFHWRNASVVTPQEFEEWLNQSPVATRWRMTGNGRMISSPRRLMPGDLGQPNAAVSLFIPVFEADLVELAGRHTRDDLAVLRRHRLKGLVAGAIGWPSLLEASFSSGTGQIAFEAFAGAQNAAEMSSETWMGIGGRGESEVLKAGFKPRFQHVQAWPFYREKWHLAFYSTHLFDRYSTRYRTGIALGGGIVLSTLVAVLLAVQVRARRTEETISTQLRLALTELDAARKERERLSHDLHDGTIQSLYALQLGLSRAAERARAEAPPLGERLAEYRRNLSGVIGELRGFILRHDNAPGPQGDLSSVLTAVVQRLRGSTEVQILTEISSDAARHLSGEQAVHLANFAREALSNALRHAHASRVNVRLIQDADAIILEVTDDGCGFNPAEAPQTGLGLATMASRAREAGGELQIDSRSGEGARLRVRVPASNPQPSIVSPSHDHE